MENKGESEMQKRYRESLQRERDEELMKNADVIQRFIEFCKEKGILLTTDNFEYIRTIGVIATAPNLLHLLNPKIQLDKEELVQVPLLEQEYKRKPFDSGYYMAENYIAMVHPYFRRGHYPLNNFAPDFVPIFLNYSQPEKYIAVDSDRVRIDMNGGTYMERDRWYGAKFTKAIADMEDNIAKLAPTPGLDPFDIQFFFGNTYSLNIKWSSKGRFKVFQAEEFKAESSTILKDGLQYFPAKYIHAEFNLDKNVFTHIDGAIHFYTEEEYYSRRDSDFNYNFKNEKQLKPLSQKMFKVNGEIEVDKWVELVSHYLTGNPLIFEYFEGHLPEDLQDTIQRILSTK